MKIFIPDDIVQEAQITEYDVLWEMAVIFLKQKRITLEQASLLLDMSQNQLLHILTDKMISTQYNANEVKMVIDAMRKQGL